MAVNQAPEQCELVKCRVKATNITLYSLVSCCIQLFKLGLRSPHSKANMA